MSVISVATSSSASSTSSLASSSSSASASSPPSATTAATSAAAAVTTAAAASTPLKGLHDISYMTMDFQSAMETFAEAWVAANAKTGHHLVSGGGGGLVGLSGLSAHTADNNVQSQGLALTRAQQCRTPPAAHATTTQHTASTVQQQVSSTNQPQQQQTSPAISTTIANNSSSSCQGRDSISPQNRPKGSPPKDFAGASSSDTPPPNAMLLVKEEPGVENTKQNGKSLPIHCIVESICTLDDGRLAQSISTPQTPTSHHISTPGIPVPLNASMGIGGGATPGTPSSSPWHRRSTIEVDSFVIIPASTSFHDLVQVALLRLGYGAESAAAAKATVVIKNWKPLNFEQISEDPLACVGDILGDLTSVVTLRMQVYRGRPGALADIKDKLLRFLLVQSHGLLVSAGCPLDELILSQICRLPVSGGGSIAAITDDCRRKFDYWWHTQLNPQSPSSSISRTPAPATPHLSAPSTPVKPNDLSQHSQQSRHLSEPPIRPTTNSTPITHLHAPVPVHNSVHPNLVQPMHANPFPAAQQKTRMRTSFDPELELPKLQRWFADNQHPSRQQIQQYVRELNGLESRRGRKPLDVNNVVYWFKNARAAQKRAEIRGVGGVGIGTGLTHLSVNGYNGHSPTNGSGYLLTDGYLNSERMMMDHRMKGNYGRSSGSAGSVVRMNMSQTMDEYSNAESDLDEEDMTEGNGTPSPSAPLSLTTGRKDDSRDTSPRPITPPKAQTEQTTFPKEEPINYHSSDHSNNNKTPTSDGEDGEDMEVVEDSTDTKNFAGAPMFRSSSVSSYTRSISPNDFLRQTAVAAAVAAAANNENECIERLAAAFPIGSNSMFGHSIMYMSQYIPSLGHHAHHPVATSPPTAASASMALSALSADERRKRNRTFIDPVTEVPRLEQWFSLNTHPSHNLILKYTEELNCMAYRQKFPRLEPKNVQFWFKNRRAKCKRLKMSLFDGPSAGHYHHNEDKE